MIRNTPRTDDWQWYAACRGEAAPLFGGAGDDSADLLAGRRILLVEDEAILALELAMELEDAGASVTVANSLEDALEAAGADTIPDGAVLDVNLHGKEVFAAADLLFCSRVPLLFYTGHGRASEIGPRYPGSVTLNKPVASRVLIRAMATLCAERG